MAHFIHFVQQYFVTLVDPYGRRYVAKSLRCMSAGLEREAAPIDLQDEKPSVAAIEELESNGQVRQERSAALNQLINCY